jgi:diaminopimelate decarboxylase
MITCGLPVYLPFLPSERGLACDGVSIASIVDSVGTPAYIYSARAIREAYSAIDGAFADYPHAIHYALKANSTLALVRLLHGLGSRADANSAGEIQVAMRAGFAPGDIVFTGVGKTQGELEFAVAQGVGTINAESAGELDRIAAVARGQGRQARVALRVNPDIDARSHPNISTGLKSNKFGVALQDAGSIYLERRALAGLQLVGVHVHIGSLPPNMPRRCCRNCGVPAFPSSSSPDGPSSAIPARWSRGWSTSSAIPTAGSSPCSTRA